MKSIIRTVVAGIAMVSSLAAFAQSNGPVTRAEVKAQLVQLERAGYNPATNDPNYPSSLHAAMTRVNDSEGGVISTTHASGFRGVAPAKINTPQTGLGAPDVGQ